MGLAYLEFFKGSCIAQQLCVLMYKFVFLIKQNFDVLYQSYELVSFEETYLITWSLL